MKEKVSIDVLDCGPLVVGRLRKCNNGRGLHLEVKHKLTLCGCGNLKTKQFCDGYQSEITFVDKKID